MIDELGRVKARGYIPVIEFITGRPCITYASSLQDNRNWPLVSEITKRPGDKVVCDKRGRPICARVTSGRSSSWLSTSKNWGVKRPDTNFLRDIRGLYKYYGVGYYPTPSSLGVNLMRSVYNQYHLNRHTSLGLGAEYFIKQHAVGGIVQTPGIGMYFRSGIVLDESSAWLKHYRLHPDKGAVFFDGGSNIDTFATYFARCKLFVPYDLPLGCFPVRLPKGSKRMVEYPSLSGIYEAYLWKEQVDICRERGIYVKTEEGYGWREMTRDNSLWVDIAFSKRADAPNEFIEKCSKVINVSAIGYHGMGRVHYCLVNPEHAQIGDRVLINDEGEPVDMFVRKEFDNSSAHMNHWNAYTIMSCNNDVFLFAEQFAQEERLIMIDYDSVMVLEKDEKRKFARKHSLESLNSQPGDWLWTKHHNIQVLNHRSFRSDEEEKTPGIPKKGRKSCQIAA